jgi:hypothetical protein
MHPFFSSTTRIWLWVGVALALLRAPTAHAEPNSDTSRACVDAHYESQKLRAGGKLVEARKRLVACSQESCPALIGRECSEWLFEVDKGLPSLILKALDAQDRDVFDVRVSENGALFPLRPDGKAVSIDPGPHTYRFEYGGQTVEAKIAVREGELRRVLQVVFDRVPAPREGKRAEARGPHLTLPSILLGGVGVAALGTSAFVGLQGRSDYRQLNQSCRPQCDPGPSNDVSQKLLIADIALGVGVASLGVATILFFTSGGSTDATTVLRRTPSVGWSVAPLASGALTSLSGTF